MNYSFTALFATLVFMACTHEEVSPPASGNQTIPEQLAENYEALPEQIIVTSPDKRVYAQYAAPTEKYSHAILGDNIEAGQLVVVVDSVFYDLTLPSEYVFEDIHPRLYDVDGDSELEFITIRTKLTKGAAIAIYKIINEELVEYAYVPEIGTAYRWLNIVAIHDLDNDGIVELTWIQTPHIGGILKLAKIESGALKVLAEKKQYSNHAIGEQNLCLSVLTEQNKQKIFYVPDQGRNKIVGFSFMNNELKTIEDIIQEVDFSKTLGSQFSFTNPIAEGNHCNSEN